MAEQTMMTLMPANAGVAWMRQLGVFIGIAAAVALGVGVVMWSRTPSYGLLYSDLSDRDLTQVMDALQAADIAFKVDDASGALMVPAAKVRDARLKLAAAGLPKSASRGFEVLDSPPGPFGSSQMAETARYQRALEEELGKSVARLSNVRGARVHLALPRPSALARDRKDPSASVLVDLYPGRVLEEGQVAAITHMVSGSVPDLKMADVTVVDQHGRLLSEGERPAEMRAATLRFDYTRKLEDSYARRVEDMLAPLVGADGVKAKVAAELDFTDTEQTSENFNPDAATLRSERTLEENRTGSATPKDARREATRNFEVDRTISHTRMAAGSIRRLSVAVLVDNHTTLDEDGKASKAPLSAAELSRITALVKEAVGFNATRGDTVNVTSADFTPPEQPEPLPVAPLWREAWVMDVGRQILGGLFALLVAFGVIRPAIRALTRREQVTAAGVPPLLGADGTLALPAASSSLRGAIANEAPGAAQLESGGRTASNELERVKQVASHDPKLAAQIVRNWVGAE